MVVLNVPSVPAPPPFDKVRTPPDTTPLPTITVPPLPPVFTMIPAPESVVLPVFAGVAVTFEVPPPATDGEGFGVGTGVAEGLGVGVAVGFGVGVGVGFGVGTGVGVGFTGA